MHWQLLCLQWLASTLVSFIQPRFDITVTGKRRSPCIFYKVICQQRQLTSQKSKHCSFEERGKGEAGGPSQLARAPGGWRGGGFYTATLCLVPSFLKEHRSHLDAALQENQFLVSV